MPMYVWQVCVHTHVYTCCVSVCVSQHMYGGQRTASGVGPHLDMLVLARGWVCLLLPLSAAYTRLASPWTSGNSSSASHLALRSVVITDVCCCTQPLHGIHLRFKLKDAYLWQILPIELSSQYRVFLFDTESFSTDSEIQISALLLIAWIVRVT